MKGKRNIFHPRSRIVKIGARGLQNTKTKLFALLLFSVMIVGLFALSPTFSSLMNSVVIKSTGKISLLSITAKSGSPADIQTAVNAMAAAGGGTVYIPAGNFTFNITSDGKTGVDNRRTGVSVPGGVNIIGAGNNQTILFVPIDAWNSTNYGFVVANRMFTLDGSNGKSIRISGIYFQGSVNMSGGPQSDNYPALSAIAIYGVKDYRVDHNTFIDFDNYAVGTSNNYVHKWNRGVIDHNIIDNPYKDLYWNLTGASSLWAYGVIVGGNYPNWPAESYYVGQYTNDTAFIEDNSFARCRHAIAESADGGWFVARYNNFTTMITSFYGSYIDVHGGGRGMEIYNNTITNSLSDYRSGPGNTGYLGLGTNPRGGAGLVFNNTFINFPNGWAIQLTNDQSNSLYKLHDYWIWSNTFTNSLSTVHTVPNDFPITLDVDYFLRAPNQTLDGFSYSPYPYPHPLTQSS